MVTFRQFRDNLASKYQVEYNSLAILSLEVMLMIEIFQVSKKDNHYYCTQSRLELPILGPIFV